MFDERYEVLVADTPVARRIHHRVRYQVYCLENGFEDPAAYPDEEERDGWDQHSVHFIVRDRLSGEWIGAMRLIKPVEGRLPIQHVTELEEPAPWPGPHDFAWELSRTCILAERRRGSAAERSAERARSVKPASQMPGAPAGSMGLSRDSINWVAMAALRASFQSGTGNPQVGTGSPVAAVSPARRVNGYEILAGMLRAAIEYTRDQDVHHLYFLVNAALARMVKSMHFEIRRAGAACDHRGIRHPYLANLDEAVFQAVTRSPEMSNLFLKGEDPYRFYSATRSPTLMGVRKERSAAA